MADLKAHGWSAQKGVRYGIPYLSIRRTGFQHVVSYGFWGSFIPQILNIPEEFLPASDKYWCWSALLDAENPNTTGFLHYGEENYFFKLRGVINSLGTDFSAQEFREAIYMMLWDPCKIPNSFTYLKPELEPTSVCPVCTPPSEFKIVIKDGAFPKDFTENFLSVDLEEKIKRMTARFRTSRRGSQLTAAMPLASLMDRFQTEQHQRSGRRDLALATQIQSNIPEHYLSRRKDISAGVRSRTWLIHDSDPGVAHLGHDVNLGNLPVTNVPAIETRCLKVWLTLPEIRDGDFGGYLPCHICLSKSFISGNERESGRRLTDFSWAENTNHLLATSGKFLNFGWGQPVLAPDNLKDKKAWYSNTIESFGIFTLNYVDKFNQAYGLESESTDLELIQSLLKERHPATFRCLICENEEHLSDLTEEFCTPASSSRYRFLVSVGSFIRIGPTTLCGDCRSKTYGTDYLEIGTSVEAFEALAKYKSLTGVIPDIDWRTRPLLRHLDTVLTGEQLLPSLQEAFEVNCAMPSGFLNYKQGKQGSMFWKENEFNWWELLHRAGLVEKFKQTARGKQGVSEDGHLCLSMLEWKFCNLLHKSGVEHIKEPRYTTSNLTRADYKIGDLYVEIAGLLGDVNYEEKLKLKLSSARERKQRVLVLSPKDVDELMKLTFLDESKIAQLWQENVDRGGLSSLAHH